MGRKKRRSLEKPGDGAPSQTREQGGLPGRSHCEGETVRTVRVSRLQGSQPTEQAQRLGAPSLLCRGLEKFRALWPEGRKELPPLPFSLGQPGPLSPEDAGKFTWLGCGAVPGVGKLPDLSQDREAPPAPPLSHATGWPLPPSFASPGSPVGGPHPRARRGLPRDNRLPSLLTREKEKE